MVYTLGNDVHVSMFNIDTGEEVKLGKIENYDLTVMEKDQEASYNNYKPFTRNREINFTCNNMILFRDDLGKIYYKKIHTKSKRLKKKYNKLYSEKYSKLWNKFFGI